MVVIPITFACLHVSVCERMYYMCVNACIGKQISQYIFRKSFCIHSLRRNKSNGIEFIWMNLPVITDSDTNSRKNVASFRYMPFWEFVVAFKNGRIWENVYSSRRRVIMTNKIDARTNAAFIYESLIIVIENKCEICLEMVVPSFVKIWGLSRFYYIWIKCSSLHTT